MHRQKGHALTKHRERRRLAYPARLHRVFVPQGLAGFSLSHVAVYRAEQYLVSGLVAIAYAASPLVNMLLTLAPFSPAPSAP